MATTYVQIGSTVTVGSGGSSIIEFLLIPATYTDLIVKLSTRSTSTGVGTIRMKINTDTSANYNYRQIQGNASSASSSTGTGATSAANEIGLTNGSDSTSNAFSNNQLYIPNYASSNAKNYSIDAVEEEYSSTAFIRITAGNYTQTTAISALTFTLSSGNFAQHSTASLYGIKNS